MGIIVWHGRIGEVCGALAVGVFVRPRSGWTRVVVSTSWRAPSSRRRVNCEGTAPCCGANSTRHVSWSQADHVVAKTLGTHGRPAQVASVLGHSAQVTLAYCVRMRKDDLGGMVERSGRRLAEKQARKPTHFPAYSPHLRSTRQPSRNEKRPENRMVDGACLGVITSPTDGRGFEPPEDVSPQQFSRLPP